MTISSATKVRDIAVECPASVRVFEKLGIDYCCGGARSLEDACAGVSANMSEVLSRLEEALHQPGDPEFAKWHTAPLDELAHHIVSQHHTFVRDEIPHIDALLVKVGSRHSELHPEVLEIDRLFSEVATELKTHMLKEEQVLFPYIAQMDEAARAGKSIPQAFFGSVGNPVSAMMKEHDHAGDLTDKISQLSNQYNPPAGACPSYRALYYALSEFEQDLHRHVHLENNVLFPRALKLEQTHKSA
jgi:regulator of cell morphogenesis and NO signaling